ncbi:scytonemin biosynthesis protein ScyA [Brasilonema octagenarum]|uniref:Thiamine pyrophosphate-binding protein n=1 Tax=Brasilonema octagenarum UFV-OR1 TaxID=417115 RepID=A0ABX1M621_9CYAN|nr:scytonemin biosynthesis protein ScyA [Brasilonema octagenarum]NMF61467.1 thiamine pyrophosphate-binding protein [Brasilonema octagenarum UFV-OR1]
MSQNFTQTNSQADTHQHEVYQPIDSPKEQTNGNSNGHSKSAEVLQKRSLTVSDAIANMMEDLGVSCAFGVNGGAMAGLWGSLSNSLLQVMNCRHEAGAAFAATEAYFASGRPTVVFTTAGPGITNALTGLFAARGEGAKVILLSACTSSPQRGRWAIQETSSDTLPTEGIFTSGALFNYATTVESAAQLPQIFRKLALGMSQPGGFVAHLSIPTAVQTSPLDRTLLFQGINCSLVVPHQETIVKCTQLLSEGPFAIWVGFGARGAAEEILQFAELTGAAVMCSPRGKGIFPEDHPQFVGVTGLGGHGSVMTYMQQQTPLRTLVLGTRLSEPTCFWNQALVPPGGFVHVDIDPTVPGVAYPEAETFAVQSDIKAFLQALLQFDDEFVTSTPVTSLLPRPEGQTIQPGSDSPVRPEVLMEAIQKVIIDNSDAIVMAECGNSFLWSTHLLQFASANRYRISTGVGAMGHAAAGVIGAAAARNSKAVAIVGDGAMLMNNEISTAVKYQIPAVWIVLNDARYNMSHQGMEMLGLKGADASIPQANFAVIARGMGAEGIRISKEMDVFSALEQAMAATGPIVVDVVINPDRRAPSKGRNVGLALQGIKSTPAQKTELQVLFPQVSFPNA